MLGRVNSLIDRGVEWAVVALFMTITAVGGLQVVSRYLLNLPLSWSEEIQIYGHVWIVFLTIPIAYNRGSHILMAMVLDRLPAAARNAMGLAVDIAWLWLGLSILVYTIRLVRVAAFQMSPSLGIPMSYVYLGMIAGGLYVGFVAVRKIAGRLTGAGDRTAEMRP